MSDFFAGFTIDKLFNYLLEILKTILPYTSGIIVFYLTSVKEKRTSNQNALQKRLETFYIPFFQFYCRNLLNTNALSSLSNTDIHSFLKFLSENLCNMGTLSQATYTNFYLSFAISQKLDAVLHITFSVFALRNLKKILRNYQSGFQRIHRYMP